MFVELSQHQLDKVKKLVRQELSYLEDNRNRYKMAQDSQPDKVLKTGNGEDYKDIIKDHDVHIWFLNEIIKSLEK